MVTGAASAGTSIAMGTVPSVAVPSEMSAASRRPVSCSPSGPVNTTVPEAKPDWPSVTASAPTTVPGAPTVVVCRASDVRAGPVVSGAPTVVKEFAKPAVLSCVRV